jgi:hypothetical protein
MEINAFYNLCKAKTPPNLNDKQLFISRLFFISRLSCIISCRYITITQADMHASDSEFRISNHNNVVAANLNGLTSWTPRNKRILFCRQGRRLQQNASMSERKREREEGRKAAAATYTPIATAAEAAEEEAGWPSNA